LAERPSPITHYVIARGDLPKGMLAAQIIHAAGETSPGDLDSGTFAVALSARDETELLAVAARLSDCNVPHKVIRECSGPWAGQAMAIGVRPGPKNTIRRYLSSLPLIR